MRTTGAPPRAGMTYLEIQIAFAVLGIALAGLAPLAAAQLRLMERAEARVYCLFPAEYELEVPPLEPATTVLRRVSAPGDAALWSRTLGASSSGWSGASASGWTLRAVDVSRRGPPPRILRLEGPGDVRWIARRGPHPAGLRWADADTGQERSPATIWFRPIPRSGPFAEVALDRSAGSATVIRTP